MIAQPAPQAAPAAPPPVAPGAPQPGAAAAPAPAKSAGKPLDQQTLQRVVMAGQQLMYNEKTRGYFIAGLEKQGDPTDIMAAEIVGLVKILDEKTTGGLPKAIVAPVAIALLVEAAHFAAQAGYFVMTKKAISVAAQKIMMALMQRYGVIDEIKAAKAKKDAAGQAPPAGQQPPPGAAPAPPAPPAARGLIQSAGA